MGFLLLEEKSERLILLIKLLEGYFNENFNIDEIHFMLDIVIQNTRNMDKELFDVSFISLIEEFTENYINNYNDLDISQIDVNPSNYVLKKEFEIGLKYLYDELTRIRI